jgi:hypothetical protein
MKGDERANILSALHALTYHGSRSHANDGMDSSRRQRCPSISDIPHPRSAGNALFNPGEIMMRYLVAMAPYAFQQCGCSWSGQRQGSWLAHASLPR